MIPTTRPFGRPSSSTHRSIGRSPCSPRTWPAGGHPSTTTWTGPWRVFEPREDGHIYDRGVDGSECHWARVLAYDPPRRVTISWDISLAWKVETDPAKSSEVGVRFIAETPERTRVELEHRHLDRHGEGWEQMHDAVGSPEGWATGLERYAARVLGVPLPTGT